MPDAETSFDNVGEGEMRSSLRLVMRAINQGWDVPEAVRKACVATATAVIANPHASHASKLRAVETILAMQRDNADLAFKALAAEADMKLLNIQGQTSNNAREEVAEEILVRVRRLRREGTGETSSIDRVVDAGLRRLGIAGGDAPGDGADAARPGP